MDPWFNIRGAGIVLVERAGSSFYVMTRFSLDPGRNILVLIKGGIVSFVRVVCYCMCCVSVIVVFVLPVDLESEIKIYNLRSWVPHY